MFHVKQRRGGQATIEFALLYGAAILPLTFMAIFVSEMLWVWHSVVDFTRAGANYAATHCWMGAASNVTGYMPTHVPRMIDMDKFPPPGNWPLSPAHRAPIAAPTAFPTRSP